MPSPGEDIQAWSKVATDNGNIDPAIDWHEGQARRTVNNSSRSQMAAHAKDRDLRNGSIITTGTGSAQAFLSGLTYTAMPPRLLVKLKIGPGLDNPGPATLNMDGIGAIEIKDARGASLGGGELLSNCYADFLWDGTNWIFLYSQEFIKDIITGTEGIIIGQQVFAVAGAATYTPTLGMECCIVECVGGGGGGGCASSNTNLVVGGGGGGSGGYSRKYATAADIGASQTVTVGAAGTAATTPGNGGNGGDTSVGTLCIAKGGGGGFGSVAGGTIAYGGVGGVVGTGDVVAAGSPGEIGGYSAAAGTTFGPGGGAGGSSYFGGAARGTASVFGSTAAGLAAGNYGSGGSGSASEGGLAYQASGAGSAGIVIITEFAGRGTRGATGATGPIGPAGPAGTGTGDVLVSGTPTAGQWAQWTDASHIQGAALPATGPLAVRTFTTSGTYTPTAGMATAIVECIGGGGGGGGSFATASAFLVGGGGGSGGYSRRLVTATMVGASQGVTIGPAGIGVSNAAGGAGGDTFLGPNLVGALCAAKGGGGGGNVTGGSLANGGTGGVTTGAVGDFICAGAPGLGGIFSNWSGAQIFQYSGNGGSSAFGGGAIAAIVNSGLNGPGVAANNYGSGGSGAINNGGGTNQPGGNGSAGVIIITEYR